MTDPALTVSPDVGAVNIIDTPAGLGAAAADGEADGDATAEGRASAGDGDGERAATGDAAGLAATLGFGIAEAAAVATVARSAPVRWSELAPRSAALLGCTR
jgi:hypothetical protein